MLAVVFPPFAQRLENSVSRACWPGFDVARSFPQFPRPLLLQPTIWTSERGADLGSGRCQPRPHLPIYRMTQKYLDWAWEVIRIVNPEQYGERSHSVGTLVVSQAVPSSIDQHLQRLKTCYLLGLDEMAIVFCRSVLESALFKALHSRGKLPGAGKIDHIRPYEFAKLLGLTDRRMLDPKKKDRARSIGDLAGSILHAGEDWDRMVSFYNYPKQQWQHLPRIQWSPRSPDFGCEPMRPSASRR